MQIDSVKLSSDIFRGLLSHSFLTEHEEVLGLLYGNYEANEVRIWGSINLIRNCKERDRVEVDELQLSQAMHKAEDLSESLQQASLLVGWFHSHPNITIFPSRVDLNTQKSLQSLGQHFIGIIISCFSRDGNNVILT
jgi:BRCA1/BRCA2-containing complex subunit 3